MSTTKQVTNDNDLVMAVVDAARVLDMKLSLIWKDDQYADVFHMAANLGFPYNGPQCTGEQEALQAALGKLDAAAKRGRR